MVKKMSIVAMAAVVVGLSVSMQCSTAQEHHIVGGDRGWATSSDIVSWASNKIFRVGDNIWFAYSAAKDSIIELSSNEDFESCNLENPIRMYTDGIDRVALENEGTRYFVSSKPENCQNGLKLNLTVLPRQNTDNPTFAVYAPEPAAAAPEPAGFAPEPAAPAPEPAVADVANSAFSATAPAPSASVRTAACLFSSVLAIFIGLSLVSSLANF